MNQAERRLWLIQQLKAEQPQYRTLTVPQAPQEQRQLLRALMNVRPPKAASPEFLQVQDAYLQQAAAENGITCLAELTPAAQAGSAALYLWQGDITTLQCDAIVNAANSGMCGCFTPLHGCIDNIIHSRSGVQLRLYCADMMRRQGHEEPTGTAKLTPAYNLPCRYILHTVGPIITGAVTDADCEALASCYRSCLRLAAAHQLESVAFCCISTGVFRFPHELAAQIAVQTVRDFLQTETSVKKVIFNVFKDLDKELYARLLGDRPAETGTDRS